MLVVPPVCAVCGLAGSKTCSKCHKVHYCSRSHQSIHWTLGQHRIACPQNKPSTEQGESNIVRQYLFNEYELDSQDMDTLDSTNSDHHHRLEDWNEEDGGEEETETGVDKTFLTFQKAISAYPDQVMRYVRVVYGEPSIPLWVSDEGQPQEGDIVGCALCGSPRTFEFQILPQLLHALNVDHSQPDALDWGTLLVYSCSSNCETDGRTVEEVVWRQDFSSQGIGDKYKQAV